MLRANSFFLPVIIIPVRVLLHLTLAPDDCRGGVGICFHDLLHVDDEKPVVPEIVVQEKVLPLYQPKPIQFNVGRFFSWAIRLPMIISFLVWAMVNAEFIEMLVYKIKRILDFGIVGIQYNADKVLYARRNKRKDCEMVL